VLAREHGQEDAEAFLQSLAASSPTERQMEILTAHLTVGETYFFREIKSLDAFRNHVIPELIRQRAGRGQKLRIWIAGCSTGEEAYTIAIILSELISNLDAWDIDILATDINATALEKARQGVYTEWSFRGMPELLRERYFEPQDGKTFAIRSRFKDMVSFARHNLVIDTYPSLQNNTNAMDVIFCRNVLMYFLPELVQKVIVRFFNCLVEGAWLIVAPSETFMLSASEFSPVPFEGATLYKKESHKLAAVDATRNSELPQFGARNSELPQFGARNSERPQFGARNSELSQFGARNSELPQFGARNSELPQFGARNSELPQFGARNSELGVLNSLFPVPSSPFPVPSSPFPVPSSPFPVPSSPFPVPSSPFPVPSSPFPVPSSPLPVPMSDSYEAALSAYQAGRYADAAAALQYLVGADGLSELGIGAGKSLALMARIDANQGKLETALEWAEKAIAADKVNPGFYYLLATILEEQHRPKDAVQALKRALYLDPSFILAHFTLGNITSQEKGGKGVNRHFINALELLTQIPKDEVLPESEGVTAGRLLSILENMNLERGIRNLERGTH
jgi:chemotaxis methyl-accepting protein methylase